MLERQGHAWLATAGDTGEAHLIAVSAAWDGDGLVIATRAGSRTARNPRETSRARLALGDPSDAVVIDVAVAGSVPATADAGPIATSFRDAVGWDPAEEGDDWHYFRLRPVRIQAYRGYGEPGSRDVMRDGAWID